MINCRTQTEDVIYEQAHPVPGYGPLLFVTIILRDPQPGRVTRESHVFLPQQNRHLHEINFTLCDHQDESALVDSCIQATHRLFADELLRSGNESAASEKGFAYVTRNLETHPFYGFQLRNQFRDKLWEIQDWTVSPALRAALARVTRYRTDSAEAELLGRILSTG